MCILTDYNYYYKTAWDRQNCNNRSYFQNITDQVQQIGNVECNRRLHYTDY